MQAQTQAAPTAPVVPVHNPAAPVAPVHGEPKAPVHAPVPVPIWNPNTPLPKMKNTSMIPFALVVALIGGAAVITLGAGIFTFFWHDLRTFTTRHLLFVYERQMKTLKGDKKTSTFPIQLPMICSLPSRLSSTSILL